MKTYISGHTHYGAIKHYCEKVESTDIDIMTCPIGEDKTNYRIRIEVLPQGKRRPESAIIHADVIRTDDIEAYMKDLMQKLVLKIKKEGLSV